MFDLSESVCERYRMTPFDIRRERFGEVCLLLRRIRKYEKRENNIGDRKLEKPRRKFIPVTDRKKEITKGG